MGKKEKKIEIQVKDAAVAIHHQEVEGYQLQVGKKVIGEIAEVDGKFVIVDKGSVSEFHKSLDSAVQSIIANYNLNH